MPFAPLSLFVPLLVFLVLFRAGWLLAVRARVDAAVDRMVCAAVFPVVAVVLALQFLGRAGFLTRGVLVCALAAVVALVFATASPADRLVLDNDWSRGLAAARSARASPFVWAVVGTALVCMAGSVASAALLETWAWDSLGYHLPLAHNVLQTGGLAEVPGRLAFIETYPRFVELFFAGFRLLLGDERFIELGQMAFFPLLCATTFRLARRFGAPSSDALACAAAPLALPVVYMQCASNYVDVAYAALLFAGLVYLVDGRSRAHEILAGTFLGLALATKPSAPLALVLGLGVSLCACVIARTPLRTAVLGHGRTGLLAAAVGAKVYVDNMVRFGNPVWPVALKLGPLSFPGTMDPHGILAIGLTEAQSHWGWLRKLLWSWLHEPADYVFDQRFGGFGPGFALAALPLLVVAVARVPRSRKLATVVAVVTLGQGGAFIARYTIALPLLALALAPAGVASLPLRLQKPGKTLLAAMLLLGAVLGARGFTHGGPSLAELWHMTPRERAAAVSVDDRGAEWFDVRAELGPGEAFAFDGSVGLTGLGFRGDGHGRLLYLGEVAPSGGELEAILEGQNVRFVALGNAGNAGSTALGAQLGARLVKRFACDADPCVVFEVRRVAP